MELIPELTSERAGRVAKEIICRNMLQAVDEQAPNALQLIASIGVLEECLTDYSVIIEEDQVGTVLVYVENTKVKLVFSSLGENFRLCSTLVRAARSIVEKQKGDT